MRHVGSALQAERGRGEVNLSPIRVLTLRPRVGGFYVSGRGWEVQSVVFYVSGRLWEAHSVMFYEALRLLGCPITNEVKRPGGVPRKGT